ncbi:MAG: metallophosphoesterase family protein [Phenylobacterium sp.]|uniref:metallophosphoesterase family protein n=1 Tax=Phenylobacterium sp. TaxID=1871053 RepID=UPI002725D710|nr:metallophosphoesterase family protein [Phenylobacterium sp.]MDO8409376.1 metallophosphoesterase family protein [Phenylobacterium sp.]
MFSRLFGKKERAGPPSTGGRRVYAIGDIHGRHDLLEALVREIGRDVVETPPLAQPLLIFLGDYVDRGPGSAQAVDMILRLQGESGFEIRALKGNHEEALLRFLDEPSFGSTWAEHGGSATLASYGVQPPATRTDPTAWAEAAAAFAAVLPGAHLDFYRSLDLMAEVGDYAFVHAGVRPGVPLAHQEERDLLWIRGEFLQATGPFGKVIVHGHTPMEEPQVTPHRLGLDTGAYATGVLTAVRLDDEGQRFIQARVNRAAA